MTKQMNLPRRVRANRQKVKALFLHVLLCELVAKRMAIFRMGLPTSNDPLKRTAHIYGQLLLFSLITDVIKLVTKICHHKEIF